MADPFLGEIRMCGFNFAPQGWAFCNGQLLAISQNTALFALLGTQFGGDGRTTFALPNLQDRCPVHSGSSAGPGLTQRLVGEMGGEPSVTLLTTQMPAHTHTASASTTGTPSTNPTNRYWGQVPTLNLYNSTPNAQLAADALSVAGGSQAHNNYMPYQAVTFIIAMQGIFPSRN
jgi:microcystin-dependent protein